MAWTRHDEHPHGYVPPYRQNRSPPRIMSGRNPWLTGKRAGRELGRGDRDEERGRLQGTRQYPTHIQKGGRPQGIRRGFNNKWRAKDSRWPTEAQYGLNNNEGQADPRHTVTRSKKTEAAAGVPPAHFTMILQ